MAVECNAERVVDTALADIERSGSVVVRRKYVDRGPVGIGDEEIALGIGRNAVHGAAAGRQAPVDDFVIIGRPEFPKKKVLGTDGDMLTERM